MHWPLSGSWSVLYFTKFLCSPSWFKTCSTICGLICVPYSSQMGSVHCYELMSGSVKPHSLQPSGRSHPQIVAKQCPSWELNKSFCVCLSVLCTYCQMKHCCLSSICPELSLILATQFDPFPSLLSSSHDNTVLPETGNPSYLWI